MGNTTYASSWLFPLQGVVAVLLLGVSPSGPINTCRLSKPQPPLDHCPRWAIKKTYHILLITALWNTAGYWLTEATIDMAVQGLFSISCSKRAQAVLGQSQGRLLQQKPGLWLAEHSLSLLQAKDRKQAQDRNHFEVNNSWPHLNMKTSLP